MSHKVFFTDEVVQMTVWHAVAIFDIRGSLTVQHMRAMEQAYLEALASNPAGTVGLVFIRAGTPVAPPDARAESTRFMKELGPRLRKVAFVVEEEGVAGVAMRTVIRGINVLVGKGSMVVSANVIEAFKALSAPLATLGDPSLEPRKLAEVTAQARASFYPPRRT